MEKIKEAPLSKEGAEAGANTGEPVGISFSRVDVGASVVAVGVTAGAATGAVAGIFTGAELGANVPSGAVTTGDNVGVDVFVASTEEQQNDRAPARSSHP